MSFKEFKDNLTSKNNMAEPYILPTSDIIKIRNNPDYIPLSSNHDDNINALTLYLPDGSGNATSLEAYDIRPTMLEGRRSKGFMLADGNLFQPLYDELRNNPNSSYVTYINDVIKDGYNPQRLSVLLYENSVDPANEMINSKLLNLFGVPTVYMQNLVNAIGMNYLLSVDFIGKNEEYMPIKNFINEEIDNTTSFKYIMFHTYTGIQTFYRSIPNFDPKNIDNNYKPFANDFAYQLFIAKYALGICDIHEGNGGILFNNETQKISVAPLFDLEYYKDKIFKTEKHLDDLIYDLEYIRSSYPETYTRIEKLCQKISTEEGQKNIIDIFNSNYKNTDDPKCKMTEVLHNINTINSTIEHIDEYCQDIY